MSFSTLKCQTTANVAKTSFQRERKDQHISIPVSGTSLLYVAAFLAYQASSECTDWSRHPTTNLPWCRNVYDRDLKEYWRTFWNLTKIPRDIPAEAEEVYLWGNKITRVPANIFSHLHDCQILSLVGNLIITIEIGAFNGLYSLKELGLAENDIDTLDPQLLRNLPRPLTLELSYPNSFVDRPWRCDTLCWLKLEEQRGTVNWTSFEDETNHPECRRPLYWDTLECTAQGSLVFSTVSTRVQGAPFYPKIEYQK